jgi:DNA ligase D-like protein (predicted 3'-phosphoesterase)
MYSHVWKTGGETLIPKKDALKSYRERRDFKRTNEPKGGKTTASRKSVFVVQKHDARNLHYDFRLEVDGVLKSWAVPKGPSMNPSEKRLAVPTEDHPLDYADFEGTIPEGEYGAGTVIVWDTGTYRSLKEKDGKMVPMSQTIEDGHLMVWLEGKKLKGGYALTRFRKGKGESWLLVKMRDEQADDSKGLLVEKPESALSGKTIEEMAEDRATNKQRKK